MSSCTVFTGIEGCTTRMDGATAISEIGTKSLKVSNGSLRYMLGFTACGLETNNRVYPSAVARATISVPMMPFAPARLSITNCRPSVSDMRLARMRLVTSEPPPGAYGTTTRISFAGYTCANRHWLQVNISKLIHVVLMQRRLVSLCKRASCCIVGHVGYQRSKRSLATYARNNLNRVGSFCRGFVAH